MSEAFFQWFGIEVELCIDEEEESTNVEYEEGPQRGLSYRLTYTLAYQPVK